MSRNTFIRRWREHTDSAETTIQTKEEGSDAFITIDTENLKAIGIKRAMLEKDGFVFQAIQKFVNDIYIKQVIEEAITELEAVGEKDKERSPLLLPKFLEKFRPLVDDPEGLTGAREMVKNLLQNKKTDWICRADMEHIHGKICGAIVFRYITNKHIPERLLKNAENILREIVQKFIDQKNLAPTLLKLEEELMKGVIMSPSEMNNIVEEAYKNKEFTEEATRTHKCAMNHEKMLEEFIKYIAQILKLALLSRAKGKTDKDTKDWIETFKSEHPEIIDILKKCKKEGLDWQKEVLDVI